METPGRQVLHRRLIYAVIVIGVFLAFQTAWVRDAIGGSEKPAYLETAESVGDETCLGCHEDYSGQSIETLHGMAAAAAEKPVKCESCHGPGSVHAGDMTPDTILRPESEGQAMREQCMTCHSGSLGSWKCRKILNCDMSCSRCHTVHQKPIKGTLKKAEKELCYDCHIDVKAKDMLPSHHPVKEGKMTCSDCHDMKGEAFFESERPNEICLNCHAQYRGPYIFEHSPVIEDCTICHEPHGTVANNLLKHNEPFMCLQCHQMHFHTQKISYDSDANGTVTDYKGREFTSSGLDAIKSGMLTKCTQCHKQIHGSDLPSQSISGEGAGLTQ